MKPGRTPVTDGGHDDPERTAVDERITDAIRLLNRQGQAINVSTVAKKAGVSRTTVYARPHAMAEIEEHRQFTKPAISGPSSARATNASLKSQNATLRTENRRLKAELDQAKRKIGDLINERRQNGTRGANVTPLKPRQVGETA